MWVKAAAGLKCPKENKPRDYITDGKAVEVEASAYYLRLINDGSLEETDAPAAKGSSKKAEGGDQ